MTQPLDAPARAQAIASMLFDKEDISTLIALVPALIVMLDPQEKISKDDWWLGVSIVRAIKVKLQEVSQS